MTDYGSTDTSTTVLATNQFPVSAVWVPNDALRPVGGAAASTDSGGKKYTSALVNVTNTNANGQAAMASSSPVVLPSDQVTQGVLSDILSMTNPTLLLGALLCLYNPATGDWERKRTITKIVPVDDVSVTAGTPLSVWTPATGKKFRLIAWSLTLSVSGFIKLEDGSGTEFIRSPRSSANTPHPSPDIGNGYLSSAANNQLFIDVSASGTVSGTLYGTEE